MDFFTSPEFIVTLMFVCAIGLLLAGFPVAFTLAGTATVFALLGFALDLLDPYFLTAFPQRILAIMSSPVLVAVPLFVFMGVMLERSKIAEDLLDNMARLFGQKPGGMAYSVTIVGALLAASTGIVGATVVTMGLMSLPVMLRRGYSKSLACGSIAASGTLGQIIPPSIVLVLLGDQLSTAYQAALNAKGDFSGGTVTANDLFAGALLPGFMLVGLYLLYQFAFTKKYPHLAPAMPKEDLGGRELRFSELLQALMPPIILIIAVLGSILGGLASPTEAAAVGAVGAIMLAAWRLETGSSKMVLYAVASLAAVLALANIFDLRMNRAKVSVVDMLAFGLAVLLTAVMAWGIFRAVLTVQAIKVKPGQRDEPGRGKAESILETVMLSTLRISAMVFTILVGAGLFSLVIRGFGGDEMIEALLKDLPGGTAGAIITVMLVMFVLGFFLDFLEIMFIVVPIVAPVLLAMEFADGTAVHPVWLGVIMAVNLQTSFLTPPFGFALFYLRGVAPPEVRTSDIYRGVMPFVAIQLFAIVLLWFMPAIATWLPSVLYEQ